MTLDEAITHAEEVAEENEQAEKAWIDCKNRGTHGWSEATFYDVNSSITRCNKCAAEHRQLAEWLKELRELRDAIKDVKTEAEKTKEQVYDAPKDVCESDYWVREGIDFVLELIDKHINSEVSE